jgi:glycosyltransferase involved in cell wall biosynthesis
MQVLFILYGTLDSNSGYQADILATKLSTLGHGVMVAHAGAPVDASPYNYAPLTHSNLYESTRQHMQLFQPDIILAWTPREIVRLLVDRVRAETPASKLIIHFEDNEWALRDACVPEMIAAQSNLAFFDPERGQPLLDAADAFTCVVDSLRDVIPLAGRPCHAFYAPYDDRLFQPCGRNLALRRALGIADDCRVIVYSGNVHRLNLADVRLLYQAVEQLARSENTMLIRTGAGIPISEGSEHVIDKGWVSRNELPGLMAAADLFVQPGCPGPFNDHRFPSKIPEMAVTGRPIVGDDLPYTRVFKNGEIVWKRSVSTVDRLVAAIRSVGDLASADDVQPAPGVAVTDTLHPTHLAEDWLTFGHAILA